MKIESSDQTIGDLLTAGYYLIPRFQRPYSWDQENISEFWDDVIRNKPSDYFIGSMVVFKISDRKNGVVDGQQRLTTITILLCVVRDALLKEGHEELSKGLHRLVEKENIDNEAEFVLQTETSYPYFQEHIQKSGDPELNTEPYREEKNLRSAHELFTKLVGDLVLGIKNNPTKNPDEVSKQVKESLANIRDALLRLNVIFIKLENEDDAYIIFETLNTRGKDLALADLVKNHFTRLIKASNKGVDQTKEKWQVIRETIEGSKIELSTDSFIHHYWLSRYEYVTAKNLFKTFKKKIIKANAKGELNSMCRDAEIYRSMHDIPYGKWTKQEKEISEALKALMMFRVRQQVPCVLSLVRAYRENVIKKKLLESALVSIEKFHFQFTAITSQRSSGGISGMYASLARRICESKNSQEAGIVIDELKRKLRERVPSESEFIALFPEVIYTNKISKLRSLVRYVLIKDAKHQSLALPGDFDDLTIEHVTSQSEIDSENWSEEYVGQLGNLLLVSNELNGKLNNKSFTEKKRILIESGYPLPDIMRVADKWTPELVGDRTRSIATRSYNEVWKI